MALCGPCDLIIIMARSRRQRGFADSDMEIEGRNDEGVVLASPGCYPRGQATEMPLLRHQP